MLKKRRRDEQTHLLSIQLVPKKAADPHDSSAAMSNKRRRNEREDSVDILEHACKKAEDVWKGFLAWYFGENDLNEDLNSDSYRKATELANQARESFKYQRNTSSHNQEELQKPLLTGHDKYMRRLDNNRRSSHASKVFNIIREKWVMFFLKKAEQKLKRVIEELRVVKEKLVASDNRNRHLREKLRREEQKNHALMARLRQYENGEKRDIKTSPLRVTGVVHADEDQKELPTLTPRSANVLASVAFASNPVSTGVDAIGLSESCKETEVNSDIPTFVNKCVEFHPAEGAFSLGF